VNLLKEAFRGVLLTCILEGSPAFFEQLIADLLVAMGYGGSRAETGEQIGGAGDDGVDGVLREDRLGLDRPIFRPSAISPATAPEAKPFGRPSVLCTVRVPRKMCYHQIDLHQGRHAVRKPIGHVRIVLVDGSERTNLMIRFGVGVRLAEPAEIKRIDLDYFQVLEAE
jgi:restriction system protein